MNSEGLIGTSQGSFLPPSCNTGVNSPVSPISPSFRLDWLRLSCQVNHHQFLSGLLLSKGLHPVTGRGRHGYEFEDTWHDDCMCVGKPVLRVWHGGIHQRDRMTIESSGRHSEWVARFAASSHVAFTLRRADLALDLSADFVDGQDLIMQALDEWPYRGIKPKPRLISDMGLGDGCTLYLGSSGGECMLRWYEKGKEQRDPLALDWMRLEFQIQPKDSANGDWMASALLAGRFSDVLRATWAPAVISRFYDGYGDKVIRKEVKMVKDFDDKMDVLTRQWRTIFDKAFELSGGDPQGFYDLFADSIARNDRRDSENRSAAFKHRVDDLGEVIPF